MTIRDIAVAFGFEVDNKSVSDAEGTIKKLKSTATKLLGAIGIGFSVSALKNFASECTQIASDVSEMESKFEVVFGNMTQEVNEWADEYADSIGRSRSAIKTYLADQQNLLVGFTDGSEEARAEAAKLSEEMTSLALDIASFANTDEDVAVERMTKAVMGESEAAKGLGAVLNDLTRQEAMQRLELAGSYNDLDQYTKMLVNLNAIQYQSKDAVGDCVNSMDRYESKTRQLAARQKDLKEFIGTQLMPVMSAITSLQIKFTEVIQKAAKAILGETEEDNKLLKVIDRIHALVKRVQPAVERLCRAISTGMGRARDFVAKVVERLGGVENVLKIAAVAAGAFMAVMEASKITSIIKKAEGLAGIISKVGKSFSVAKLKALAIIAVIVILALLIEDFINFMQGNDSVIGSLFEKAGIDADAARETIQKAWESITGFLSGVWNGISEAAHEVFGELSEWWDENGDGVLESLSGIWESIKELLSVLWEGLSETARTVFGALQEFWDDWGETIMSVFGTVWDTLVSLIQPFLDAVSALIGFITDVFTGDWEGAWENVKELFSSAWEAVSSILSGAAEIVATILNGICENILGIDLSELAGKFEEGFQGAIDFITGLPEQALQWGADIINSIAEGITGAIGKVTEAVSGVGEKIKSFLHFSVPDEGPLADFQSWMPDFMRGMAEGIGANKDEVLNKVKSLAGGISVLIKGATASASTVANSAVNNTSSTSVTQNNTFNNSYSGSDAQAQKNISKGMKRSAQDATAYLAKGLAYAR